MPTPKFRTSASKRDMRRAHHALRQPGMSFCANCGDVKQPHTICRGCGHYKGKSVMTPKQSGAEWDGEDFEVDGKK